MGARVTVNENGIASALAGYDQRIAEAKEKRQYSRLVMLEWLRARLLELAAEARRRGL